MSTASTSHGQTTKMPTPSATKPLTLIVATTKSHGIGLKGSLPWPQLKGEMAYFARVTKRPPPPTASTTGSARQPRNAVIMGRRTWESIPSKFRPLKGRLNCVVSRSLARSDSVSSAAANGDGAGNAEANGSQEEDTKKSEKKDADVLFVQSIEEALETLRVVSPEKKVATAASLSGLAEEDIGHVFVIGGSSIYEAALRLPYARRVLLTEIREPEFECDTYFPLDMEGDEALSEGWKRTDEQRLQEVTGEDFGSEGAIRKEGNVVYEFCLYER